MGIFSSSTEYLVYAASSHLVDEADYQDTTRKLVLSAVLHDDEDLGQNLLAAPNVGFNARGKAFLRYGRKHYVRGLPENTFTGYGLNIAKVQARVQQWAGEPVTLKRAYLGPMDPSWRGEMWLKFNGAFGRPWDRSDREVTLPPILNAPRTTANVPITTLVNNVLRIRFAFTDTDSGKTAYATACHKTIRSYSAEVYQVSYEKKSEPGKTHYWQYDVADGHFPELAPEAGSEDASTYLPVAILIRDRVPFNQNENSDLAVTTNRLLRKLGVRGSEILEQAYEAVDESKDVNRNDLTDFFVHFGAPLRTRQQATLEYLYRYFEFLQGHSQYSWLDYQEYLRFLSGPGGITSGFPDQPIHPYTRIEVKEGGTEGYNVQYAWFCIEQRYRTGRVLEPGKLSIDIYHEKSPDYRKGFRDVFGSDAGLISFKKHDYVVLTWQETDNKYRRILVMGPSMRYVINVPGPDKYAIVELVGDNQDQFFVPISVGILNDMNYKRQERLLQDSAWGTVFLVDKVKVPWYQKNFFKFLTFAITIVIIAFAPYITGFLQYIGFSSQAAAAFMKYATQFMIGLSLSQMGEIGAILGIAYAIYSMGGLAGLKNLAQRAIQGGFMAAARLIETVTKIIVGGFRYYSQQMLKSMEQEMRELMQTLKEREEELEDAWYALKGTGSSMSWMDIMRKPAFVPAEGPAAFYARTLEANPGVLSFTMLEQFHEQALAPPDYPGQPNIVSAQFMKA